MPGSNEPAKSQMRKASDTGPEDHGTTGDRRTSKPNARKSLQKEESTTSQNNITLLRSAFLLCRYVLSGASHATTQCQVLWAYRTDTTITTYYPLLPQPHGREPVEASCSNSRPAVRPHPARTIGFMPHSAGHAQATVH